MKVLSAILVLIMTALPQQAQAASPFGSFDLPSEFPNALVFNGEITAATHLEFKRALAARPAANTLFLNSPGGSVYAGLAIALEIRENNFKTIIPKNWECLSACAFLFFAGVNRTVQGDLGVHQISSTSPFSSQDTQVAVAEIIDVLFEFGASSSVISIMLRTDSESIHIFSHDEILSYGIESHENNQIQTPIADGNEQVAVSVVRKNRPLWNNGTSNNHDYETEVVNINSDYWRYILLDQGVKRRTLDLFSDMIFKVINSEMLPANSKTVILFGTSRVLNYYIPHRISFYTPIEGSPKYKHAVTVALLDDGQYVLGLDPREEIAPPKHIGEGGKTDRLRRKL